MKKILTLLFILFSTQAFSQQNIQPNQSGCFPHKQITQNAIDKNFKLAFSGTISLEKGLATEIYIKDTEWIQFMVDTKKEMSCIMGTGKEGYAIGLK